MNTNRNKGHSAERFYAKCFREMGFPECVTSRYGSRIHDDAGIDLLNLPINVQIKAGKQKGLNPSKVLLYMENKIKELLQKSHPQEAEKPSIVIHHKEVTRGKKRTDQDVLVHMSFKDFIKILQY